MFAGLVQRSLFRSPAVASSGTSSETWNPSDKTAGVSLSGGNLTATASGADGVRGTPGFTGKKYFEVLVGGVAGITRIGVADSTATLDTTAGFIGDSTNTHGGSYDGPSGAVEADGSSFSPVPNYSTGDIVGVAVDEPNKLVWFAKNNTWVLSGDPAAGTNGKSISSCTGSLYPIFQTKFGTSVATYQATNTYSPPSGFTAL